MGKNNWTVADVFKHKVVKNNPHKVLFIFEEKEWTALQVYYKTLFYYNQGLIYRTIILYRNGSPQRNLIGTLASLSSVNVYSTK